MKRILHTGILLIIAILTVQISSAQSPDDLNARGFGAPDPDRPVGVTRISDNQVADGYVLMPIIQSPDIILVANDGRVVNIWQGENFPGNSAYLKENGNLLRTTAITDSSFEFGAGNLQWGPINGRIEELTWDGELVWSYDYSSDRFVGHHDIEPMPNGHVLMLAFERFSADEAIDAGFNPMFFENQDTNLGRENTLWSEKIIEIDPATDEIVWEWRLWDHLIQDFDENAQNYGVVADHPELVNINFIEEGAILEPNWWHVNSVAYNAELDQIILSPRRLSEIWIIDHGITTEEAKGSPGDLLYRWGNPKSYDGGTGEDRQLYFQHDPHWIPKGYPGEGDVLIFDNGGSSRLFSRVIEITLPDTYTMTPGEPTGPTDVVWEYVSPPGEEIFYSSLISSAQRLLNGNTLIDEGLTGRVFEVTSDGEIVWEYYAPPAAWVFRAQRYNWPVFENFDLSGDLEFTGGGVWGMDCQDGSRPRLHEYLPQENSAMQLFLDTHGDRAQEQWETEACAEHGGRVNSD